MGIPRFFKTKEAKKFNYNPLYWDPEKEAREHRIRSIKQEMGVESDEIKLGQRPSAITRGSFRQYSSKSKARAGRDSNRRLIMIIIILLLLAYIFFYR